MIYCTGKSMLGEIVMTLSKTLAGSAFAVAALTAMLFAASPAVGQGKKAAAAPEPKTSVCFLVHHPVCATKGSTRQTYTNSCYARLDGAKDSKPGACPVPKAKKAKKAKR